MHEAAQNCELLLNMQDQKLKIKNLSRLMSFSRPIQWYHSHGDHGRTVPLKVPKCETLDCLDCHGMKVHQKAL